MRPISSFIQIDGTYQLNGVVMTREELDLFLGMHGLYVEENLGNVDHYTKSLSSLQQLPVDQFTTSLDHFSTMSKEARDTHAKYVENKRKLTKTLKFTVFA